MPSPKNDPIRRTLAEIPEEAGDEALLVPAVAEQPLPPPPLKGAPPGAGDNSGAVPFRPVRRPPMALLDVHDDSGRSGEILRIRGPRFLIGRAEGDLVIPHDPQISGKHAEIVRLHQQNQYEWRLRDLKSTNGTFVRTKTAVLKDNTELLVARLRFRFVASTPGEAEAAPEPAMSAAAIGRTITFGMAELATMPPDRPHLLELLPRGEGRKLPLAKDTEFLGRDPRQCGLSFADEPTLNPRHAKLYCDAQGRWHIDDLNSLNGVWIRVTEVPLTNNASFLLGDQVFTIGFP